MGRETKRSGTRGWAVGSPASVVEDVVAGRRLGRLWLRLAAVMMAGAAIYGAAMGLWHGGRLAAYVALKLPLVLLATAALTMVFNWVVARMAGLLLTLLQVGIVTFLALATGAVLLASLAPITLFFTLTIPGPGPEARVTHNLLVLLHTLFVGASCTVGTGALWGLIRRLAPGRAAARRVFTAWLLVFASVGGEVAWAFRPFVGSIYKEVAFLRADALDGTVYEFVLFDVLPFLGSEISKGENHER